MRRDELGDLTAFLAVAEERSFTHAAVRLGTSQSSLSQTVRRLEARLGVRLVARTTRSVAATEAGERLIETLRPAFGEIDAKLAALGELREKPAGTVRITTPEYAADAILWPALRKLLPAHPDIKVELITDYGLTDIVAERYDAGVRLGEQVAKDMVAVRIGPDLRMAVVGAAGLLRAPAAAKGAARPDRSRLHHHPPADLRRTLCLGIRERQAQAEGAGRRAARVQQPRPEAGRGAGRVRPRVPARGFGAGAHRRGAARPRARRLVPTLPRLPSLLSQPPPAHAGLRPVGRGAALSRLTAAELPALPFALGRCPAPRQRRKPPSSRAR